LRKNRSPPIGGEVLNTGKKAVGREWGRKKDRFGKILIKDTLFWGKKKGVGWGKGLGQPGRYPEWASKERPFKSPQKGRY